MTKLKVIRELLGEPFLQTDDVLLYNLDCDVGLSKLFGNLIIDCTITSPPYNIGKEYEDVQPIEKYIGWLHSISSKIYDVTVPNGSYLLNVGYLEVKDKARALPIPYLLWDKINFFLNQEIIWNYGAGVASKKYLSPRNEKILWYVKDQNKYTFNLDAIRDPDVKYPHQKKNGRLRCNTVGKNPSDVWQIAKVTSGTDRASPERTDHPAQFPEDLVRRMVRGFSNPGNLILDPFMGSGTTAVVAIREKRLCLGFETKKEYCTTAKRRILEVKSILAQEELALT